MRIRPIRQIDSLQRQILFLKDADIMISKLELLLHLHKGFLDLRGFPAPIRIWLARSCYEPN